MPPDEGSEALVIVLNLVQAMEGRAEDFERAFLERERLLNQAEGFAGFELLKRDRELAHGNEIRRYEVLDVEVPA